MTQPNLLLITGSLRRNSYNLKLVTEAAKLFEGNPVMADLDLPLYNGDVEDNSGIPDKVLLLRDQIAAADAVAISTPEYNQSLSGVLKNALDWASRPGYQSVFKHKPVAVLGASPGVVGTARGQQRGPAAHGERQRGAGGEPPAGPRAAEHRASIPQFTRGSRTVDAPPP